MSPSPHRHHAAPTTNVWPVTGTSERWRLSGSSAVLGEVRDPAVDLACWQRSLPDEVTEGLARWAPRLQAPFDGILSPEDSVALVLEGCEEPLRSWLRMDIWRLLSAFTRETEVERAHVSFGAVRDDRCRKFHVDYHLYRLITTYLGPGTQWATREVAETLHPSDCPCDEPVPEGQVQEDQVHHASAGDVLLFKGMGHPNAPRTLHRSPPIPDATVTRIVLVFSTLPSTRA